MASHQVPANKNKSPYRASRLRREWRGLAQAAPDAQFASAERRVGARLEPEAAQQVTHRGATRTLREQAKLFRPLSVLFLQRHVRVFPTR